MANTLLTLSQITRKAGVILHQKANFIGAVNRSYDDSFGKVGAKIGDTLRVRLPNEYVVRSGMTMQAQNTTEAKVDLAVTSVKGVDLNFTSEELALSLDDFSDRILDPAMSVLAANIESDFYTNMYKSVYNLVDGDAAAFSFLHLAQARQVLAENLAPPSPRHCILTPAHATKYMYDTKGLYHDGSQIAEAYREGKLGRIQGADVWENSIFGNHTTGTAVKTSLYTVNGTTQSGSTITIQTGTTTFLKGDVVTFAGCYAVHPETKVSTGVLKQFVVTADSGANATSLAISPALTISGPSQNVNGYPTNVGGVVKVGAAASETIGGSMMFHRDAFIFATADLPLPDGTDKAARATVDGIALSVIRDFTISDRQFPCRLDVLYGYAAYRPQLAVRIHADG